MHVSRILAAGGLFAAIGLPASGHDFALGDLAISHPYTFETASTARTGAGYMEITNGGGVADRLIAARSDASRTELHTTEVDEAGIARMIEVEAIEIPPGETITFEPRGLHVMFMGIAEPFTAGETVEATLVFETAGEVTVGFAVQTRPATGTGEGHDAMDHGTMDHDGDGS